jgi:predicted CXXCH cytochrome family protein
MACTSCHDPHRGSKPEALAALATPAGNHVCTGCHKDLGAPDALRAHAHHDPAGEAGACLACHMPRKNMGLDYELTRYHRIGSPNDPARVQADRPLECALCHAREGAGTLLEAMERWWGKRYDRAAIERLYGDLRAPVLDATLRRGLPHEQAVAMSVLGKAGVRSAEPAIAAQLIHDYPLVRYQALRALGRLRGAPVALDVERPLDELRAAVLKAFPRAILPPPRAPAPAADGDPED